MAWYYPVHSCGHEGERVQLYGKVAWAYDLRERMLAQAERTMAIARQSPDPYGIVPTLEDFYARIREIDEARWWIDRRGEDLIRGEAQRLVQAGANQTENTQ